MKRKPYALRVRLPQTRAGLWALRYRITTAIMGIDQKQMAKELRERLRAKRREAR